MSPRRILGLALRIIRQFRHDRRTLALVFVVPLVVMTLLQIVLGSSSGDAKLGIVPPDGPFGSQLVQQLQDKVPEQITLKVLAAGDVDATLKAGDADGVLIFPADFLDQIQSGATPTLTLRLEGSNPAAATQLRGMASLLVASLPVPGGAQSPGQPPSQNPGQNPGQSTGQSTSPARSSAALRTSYLYGGPEFTQTDALAPLFIGLFAFFFVFLLTAVAFLRERSQGTLERLRVSPLSRTELVLGYVVGFTLFALIQSTVILLYVVYVLRVHYHGNLWLIFLVTAALTVAGVNLGIFASAFARNELQVIQFIPLLIVPQALLGGLFFPVATLPVVIKQIAYAMPLTYANFALRDVMLKGMDLDAIWPDLAFLGGFAVLMVVAAALSLRQERV
jgi:ABC-2 type transport system permease protein